MPKIKDAVGLSHFAGKFDDDEVPVSPDIIPRDQWNRPLIALQSGGPRLERTRSSGFGKYFEDTEGVNKWGQGICCIGVGKSTSLQVEANALGQSDLESKEGKKHLKQLREAAYELGGGNDGWRKGKALHRITDIIDEGREPSGVPTEFEPILERYRELMVGYEVVATEVFGANDRWLTAGTFDFLLRLKGYLTAPDGTIYPPGSLIMGDKKTSGSSEYFRCKFTVQLTTYATGVPINKLTGEWMDWDDIGGQPDQKWGRILHFPSDPRRYDGRQKPVHTPSWHWVSLADGERQCNIAAQIRAENQTKPITRCRQQQPVAEHPHEVLRRNAQMAIAAADSLGKLRLAWRRHQPAWDDLLDAEMWRKKAEIESRESPEEAS